jgi:hypothetical protein
MIGVRSDLTKQIETGNETMIHAQYNPTKKTIEFRAYESPGFMTGASFKIAARHLFGGTGCLQRAAVYLDVSINTISTWTSGRCPVPRYAVIGLLMKAFDGDRDRVYRMVAMCSKPVKQTRSELEAETSAWVAPSAG